MRFNLNTGALSIAEVQYAANQPDKSGHSTGLPGTYKLGFWYDTAKFPSQRFDTLGRSLVSPASNGAAAMRSGNFSLYAVADQMIWRPGPKSAQSLNAFIRLMAAPADRNLISFSVNGGVTLKAPFSGRDDDTLGLGFGVAKVSTAASALDRDVAFYTGSPYPVRGAETFVEATYQYQIAPWWQVQPDFQYVFNPGGGILNPLRPGKRIGDEAVFGVRTLVTF